MRITIEHNKPKENTPADEVPHSVSIEHPYDDLTATQFAGLVHGAMIACGYHPDSVSFAFYETAISNGFDPDEDSE